MAILNRRPQTLHRRLAAFRASRTFDQVTQALCLGVITIFLGAQTLVYLDNKALYDQPAADIRQTPPGAPSRRAPPPAPAARSSALGDMSAHAGAPIRSLRPPSYAQPTTRTTVPVAM